MSDKIFLDTNILIYAVNSLNELQKTEIAKGLLKQNPLVSPQIIFEWINVSRRKFKLSKDEYLELLSSLMNLCQVAAENLTIVDKALELIAKHSLQPFDAKIIATALFHNSTILYSEDMQNGLVIENKLTIVNPFFR